LRRRLPSVDRIPIDRPIFVLGVQAGGTTLIARCLLRHRDVTSMSGNSRYWVATDEIGFVRNRMARLPSSLWSSSHRDDLDDPVFGSTHTSVYACDDLLPAYRRTAADARAEDAIQLKRLIREHLHVYAHDPRRARFLDKTHTYTVKVGYLEALLDGCDPLFLLVLRNPYTACFSAVRRKPPSWRTSLPEDEQLRVAAEHWRNSFGLALEDGAKTGRLAAVRFEDFAADPVAVVRAICAFAGLDFDVDLTPQPGQRRPFATLPSDRKWYPLYEDAWRAQVLEAEAAIIDEVCQPLARELGYAFEGDGVPSHPLVLTPVADDPGVALAVSA
jgi:Sulfotransferase family